MIAFVKNVILLHIFMAIANGLNTEPGSHNTLGLLNRPIQNNWTFLESMQKTIATLSLHLNQVGWIGSTQFL